MHADQLRMAVVRIVELLDQVEIASILNQYRAAKGDQRITAGARLQHAAALLVQNFQTLNDSEKQITKILHLDSLGSSSYWRQLFASAGDPKQHQGEIVRLASRVMFAGNHLPGMLRLVSQVNAPQEAPQPSESAHLLPLEAGEGRLCIRLTDAGERASDPDRVARSIDGIDMLYSACASIARKPAIDLRIDNVMSKRNRDRDILFTGEQDSVAAVYAVIESIPEALSAIDTEQEINLDAIVRSLPVFQDLNTLASLGTFSKQDLKDISDTMHQGALLTLESGVIPIDPSTVETQAARAPKTAVQQPKAPPVAKVATARVTPITAASSAIAQDSSPVAEVLSTPAPVEQDEHYENYLREREAMLNPQPVSSPAAEVANVAQASDDTGDAAIDQSRRDAVDDLLKSLGQSRGH